MKNNSSLLNQKKKIGISTKGAEINHLKLKEKLNKNNQKFKNDICGIMKYNTVTDCDSSKQNNEQNYIKEFEIEKIKSNNISKFNFRNNNTIKLEKKFIKLYDDNSNSPINHTENNIINKRGNSNNTQLLNGGNHEKLNFKLILKNKNPVKLRKINTNIGENYTLENNNTLLNDKNLQTITALNTISPKETENVKSNKEKELINKLQEEIQKLKEENQNNDIIINNLKNEIEEIKNEKIKTTTENSFESEKGKEKEENLDLLNSIEENDIFEKLRANYNNNKNIIDEFMRKNNEIKITIINRKNNIIRVGNKKETKFDKYKVKRDYTFNYSPNISFDENDNNNDIQCDILNNYVENNLKKNHRDCFMIKQLDIETKTNTKLMLKLIINSNKNINKDEIINLFMNNLFDYYKTVEIFASKYLNITNTPDIKLLKNYFKSIFFDEEKKFNVNNVFNEIISFFDDDIKKIEEINIFQKYNKYKDIITKIVKKCKDKDFLETGLVELNLFNKIFDEIKDEKGIKNEKDKIYIELIYNMKKNKTDEQVGLFFLSYCNLCDIFGINDI